MGTPFQFHPAPSPTSPPTGEIVTPGGPIIQVKQTLLFGPFISPTAVLIPTKWGEPNPA